MITLRDALEEIVSSNAFLEDAIYNSYLNISSFAEYIKPQIEKLTKKYTFKVSKKKVNLLFFYFFYFDFFF